MFQQMKKRIKNEKGLTLIELLAVIVILSIVAAIAIPAIGNIIENSREKAAKSDVANIMSAAALYFTDNPSATKFTDSNTSTTGAAGSDDAAAEAYISDSGSLTSYTVTKAPGGNTVEAKGTLPGGETGYTVTALTTLKKLNVSEPNVKDDGFLVDSKDE